MILPSKAVVAAAAFSVLGASAVGSVFNATPARAAGITFVQGTAISTGTKVVSVPMTLSSAIGSGDLLVGWFSEYNASGQVTVSDSVNGAWTRGPSALTYAGAGDIALYYLADSQAASGLTITVTAPAAAYLGGAVGEYSGVALSAPLDQMAVAAGVGTAVDSGATAAVAAGDLVFGALITGGTPGGETPGTSSGVTYTPAASADSGSAYAEDITSAAAGPQNGTATLSTSTDWYAVAAAFLAVPAGAVAPAAPTNVAAPTVTSSNVTLSWTASTDNVPVTGYTVYRDGVQIGTTATTGYNDTTVAPSTAYSYTVTATNGAAQTSPASSPALPVTTPAAPPPSIAFVQGNTVTTGSQVASTTMPLTKAVGAGDLLVGWFSLYNGATGTLQVSDNVNGAWRRGPSSLAFQNDTGDIALYYKENSKASPSGVTITVASASGIGYLTGVVAEYSDVAVAGALDQMTTARAISTSIDTGLTGAADATELVYSAALIDASGTETITPGSSQGVTFTPRAQTTNGSAYEQDITSPAAGPQHGPATLSASADWYAATVVFRQLPTGTTTAPSAPTGLSAPSVATTRVALSWSAASDADTAVTGYTVYRDGVSIGITASSSTTFIDLSTAASTTYSYKVDAFNGTGQHSAPSAALGVTTPATSPEFIQGSAGSVGAPQTSLQIVLPKPVLAGDLLMGWYGQFNVPGQVQVSDNVNGTWTRSSATESFQGTGDIALEYVQDAEAAPSGITITVTIPAGPSAYLQEVVAQFRGVSTTSALDQFAVAESNQGTAISAGPTAAVAAGDLVVGAVITGGQPGNITAGSSDSVPYINDVVDAQNGSASSDLEDILSSAPGPQTANATLGVGGDWYMVVAAFRPLPPTFALSGVVLASGGTTPLSGTSVYAFDGTTYLYDGAAAMGTGGTYTINLPAGTYKLFVGTNSTPGYPDQWLGGTDYASATVVTVGGATTRNITLVGTTLFALSGVVLASDGTTPLSGTSVYAFDGTTYLYDGAAAMGTGGTYTINLPAGTYKLFVGTNNTPGYPDQWLGGTDYASATVVTVGGATTRNITLVGTTLFALSGVVLASDGTTPLSGTSVYAFDGTTYLYDGAAAMGTGGTYTINLPAGTYKLFVGTNSTPGYPDQWLGGTDYASATVVTVGGATTRNITLVGTTLFALSGVVLASDGTTPLSGTSVYAFDGTTYLYDGAAAMGTGGTYTINLPAGTYKLFVGTNNTPGYPDQWLGGTDYASATVVTVGGATTRNITLVGTTLFALSGVVLASDGTTPLSGTSVYAFDGTTYLYDGAAAMGTGGTYTINLPAGTYKLFVGTNNTPGYPDQWLGGTDYASATVVTVGGATTRNITLVGTTLFALSGVVLASDGTTPLSGTSVYAFDGTTYLYDGAAAMGTGGTYTINLPAGTYKLFVGTNNTPGYPDQWLGGTDYASATVVTVGGATTRNITLTP